MKFNKMLFFFVLFFLFLLFPVNDTVAALHDGDKWESEVYFSSKSKKEMEEYFRGKEKKKYYTIDETIKSVLLALFLFGIGFVCFFKYKFVYQLHIRWRSDRYSECSDQYKFYLRCMAIVFFLLGLAHLFIPFIYPWLSS